MEDLETMLREVLPSCLVQIGDRFYATKEGATRLENHLRENGFELSVSVTQDGRYDIHPDE